MTEALELIDRDYLTDPALLLDPYEFFRELRERGRVIASRAREDLLIVTGFQEALDVLNNPKDFSSAIAPGGPVAPLPFVPEGDDLTPQIEAHRDQIIAGDLLVALDDTRHANARAVLNRLFVPSRLKANEAYINELAETMVRDAVQSGGCEVIKGVAVPFVTLVIADLLGVPSEDREQFTNVIENAPPPGSIQAEGATTDVGPLEFMAGFFVRYLMERRAAPNGDVLSDLATATYPDGTLPDVIELVKLSTFLFGAGQDTSAKLLGNSMLYLTRMPDVQRQLREDPSLIPAFIEEVLRLEGSSKVTFRLARRDTNIGDLPVKAGTKVMIALAAANRDPARWENPDEFQLNRPKLREQLAFGRGGHVCSGAPLARVEIRIILEKFLKLTSNIAIDEAEHGSPADPALEYEASFIVRGLEKLNVKLTPAAN
ncbi:cytochrome P450 [Novosphingobium sp. PhB165]|uniref:cytochrome P450 n=1 Tax=Novosphingobium sp. PhB165 TaxID=2485105 RepID=UPI001044B63A|nr:cytochrome P450 [Novosphingobium sp. PhB165]TCM20742.1 cytochrome P450 [Novosphingobium sp. PhB165]